MSLKSKVWQRIRENLEIENQKVDDLYDWFDIDSASFNGTLKCTMTAEQWRSLQREVEGLRLKYNETKDRPLLVSFGNRGPLLTPEEFFRDYLAEQFKKMDEVYSFFGGFTNGIRMAQQRTNSKTRIILEADGFNVF